MKWSVAVMSLALSTALFAQEGMIVLAGKLSFLAKPPVGWIADTTSGASQGVNVVLYPKGQTWQNAPAVMYARVEAKRGQPLGKFVATDEKVFQGNCPGIQIQSLTIKTNPQYPIQSRRFSCASGDAQNSELVSYVDAGSYVVIWVASARKAADLAKAQPAFEQVIRDFMVWDVRPK